MTQSAHPASDVRRPRVFRALIAFGSLVAAFDGTGSAQAALSPPLLEIGSLLVPGMQLVYASDGVPSPPWTIDSVVRFAAEGRPGRAPMGCVRIRLRISPTQASEARVHCLDSTTMVNLDERSGQSRPARPLLPGMSLELRQANGGLVSFETSKDAVDQIPFDNPSAEESPLWAMDVLPTTVTTRDSTGTVVRRLRERFSVGLATATGGVFEVPDSTQATEWRTVRRFELVQIRKPR